MDVFVLRWSEYTVYRTALDNFGDFDALHTVGPTRLLGDSVCYSEDFDRWNATAAFEGEKHAYFCVTRSTRQSGPEEDSGVERNASEIYIRRNH